MTTGQPDQLSCASIRNCTANTSPHRLSALWFPRQWRRMERRFPLHRRCGSYVGRRRCSLLPYRGHAGGYRLRSPLKLSRARQFGPRYSLALLVHKCAKTLPGPRGDALPLAPSETKMLFREQEPSRQPEPARPAQPARPIDAPRNPEPARQ